MTHIPDFYVHELQKLHHGTLFFNQNPVHELKIEWRNLNSDADIAMARNLAMTVQMAAFNNYLQLLSLIRSLTVNEQPNIVVNFLNRHKQLTLTVFDDLQKTRQTIYLTVNFRNKDICLFTDKNTVCEWINFDIVSMDVRNEAAPKLLQTID